MKKFLIIAIISGFVSCIRGMKKVDVDKEPQGKGWVMYSQGHYYCLEFGTTIVAPGPSIDLKSKTHYIKLQGSSIQTDEKPSFQNNENLIRYNPVFKKE